MEKKYVCPKCHRDGKIVVVDLLDTISFKGEDYSVYHCKECSNSFNIKKNIG